jgi:hypothetical protein
MHATQQTSRRIVLNAAVVLAALSFVSPASAVDTLLSGFEGNLSSAIGTDWIFQDARGAVEGDQLWPHQFVAEGATEGAQALQITHFTDWTAGFTLKPSSDAARNQLINMFATNDTLEFDMTTPAGISWRQIFVVVNSDPTITNWSQVQIDLPANATTHFSIPLTNPDPTDPTKNWKQSAITGGATATYWEIVIALQGTDNTPTADFDFDTDVDGADFLTWQRNVGNMEAGPEQGDTNFDFIVDGADLAAITAEFGRNTVTSKTTIDNIKFVSNAAVAAVPEPSAAVIGLMGAVFAATATARGRRRQ